MSSRVTVVAAFAFGLSLSSCGGNSVTLPPVLAASAHFRYHVEPPQLAASGIRSALESNRADVLAYLGLPDDDQVIDYYLLFTTSVREQCATQESCARGRQVFSASRLDRHELMHAFLVGAGDPPHPIQEGIAEAVSCYEESLAYDSSYATWQELFQTPDDQSSDFQVASMRLVRQLLLQYGPQRFLDYYRTAKSTTDAAAFASEFQRFWSVSVDEVWASANSATVTPVPICPCRAPPMTPGPAPIYLDAGSYQPLGVDPNAMVTLSYAKSNAPTLYDCSRSHLPVPLATDVLGPFRRGLVMMALDEDARYLMAGNFTQDLLTLTAGNGLAADCESALPLSVGYDVEQIAIVVPRGGPKSFSKLSPSETGAVSARSDTNGGSLMICSDCSLSDCSPLAQEPSSTPISASGAVLMMDASSLPGTGVASFTTTLEFP
jgi:hypothetical protein